MREKTTQNSRPLRLNTGVNKLKKLSVALKANLGKIAYTMDRISTVYCCSPSLSLFFFSFLPSSALNEFYSTGMCCELCHLCKHCRARVTSLGENEISGGTGSALAATDSSLLISFSGSSDAVLA